MYRAADVLLSQMTKRFAILRGSCQKRSGEEAGGGGKCGGPLKSQRGDK